MCCLSTSHLWAFSPKYLFEPDSYLCSGLCAYWTLSWAYLLYLWLMECYCSPRQVSECTLLQPGQLGFNSQVFSVCWITFLYKGRKMQSLNLWEDHFLCHNTVMAVVTQVPQSTSAMQITQIRQCPLITGSVNFISIFQKGYWSYSGPYSFCLKYWILSSQNLGLNFMQLKNKK